ncbi:MAG: NYN domain-containing protein [Paludibacteraceae bacterium]|nr:NYN domain-containing protein [Paludibacteraceae bacterium]
MARVTVYVDGFNFYYGLRTKKREDRKWLKSYWIDLVKLFEQFLGEEQTLEKVIYFTASPLNKDKSARQSAFLNANKLINGQRFEIVRGKYLEKAIKCPNCHYTIIRPEEKKTDVNISIRMIADCVQDKTDIVVLVSGDSDLVPPIEFIQKNYACKRIRVYFPPSISSSNLASNMKLHKGTVVYLEKNFKKFEDSAMPEVVVGDGKTYTIPEKWKINVE